MPYEPDYTILVNLFVKLVDSQAGKEIADNESWKNDAQVLSSKLFQHLVSRAPPRQTYGTFVYPLDPQGSKFYA